MSQDWMQQGPPPPPPPPPPPAYNPYGYGGAPPPTMGGSGLPFPWEDRARLGFVNALIETIKLVVTQPVEAFSRLQPNGDLTSPLIFGLIVSWPGTIAAMVWQLIFGSIGGGGDQLAAFGMLPILIILVCYPILYAIGVFIGAGIFHLCLMVVKGLEQSSFGFEGTLKVVCYGSIGSLAQVVPFLGGLVGGVLNLYLNIMGIRTVHRTTTGTAVLAILLPIILCCVCGIVLVFVGGFGAAMMGPR